MIMRAMQEAVISQVLVAQPVLVVEAEPFVVIEDDGTADEVGSQSPKKASSLLQMAISIRPAGKSFKRRNAMVREAAVTTESLVQTSHSHHSIHSVSRLLVDLLVNRKRF